MGIVVLTWTQAQNAPMRERINIHGFKQISNDESLVKEVDFSLPPPPKATFK